MEKKRLLIITQELEPYTEGPEISSLVAKLPKFLQDTGYELRILMPRYGVVNERRHRLHEHEHVQRVAQRAQPGKGQG